MFKWLVFLGLLSQSPEEDTALFQNTGLESVYNELLPYLVSADPLARIRAAWLLPDYVINGETIAPAGFRSEETRFMLEDVSLQDPQTLDITLFLPSFMIEKGTIERQSGSIAPAVNLFQRDAVDHRFHLNLKTTSPFFFPDAKNGQADLSADVPLGNKLTLSLDGSLMRWQHRPLYYQLQDSGIAAEIRSSMSAYTGAATATIAPSPGMRVRISLIRSLNQRDIFSTAWIFNPQSAPASYSLTDFLNFDYSYVKETFDLRMTLSRYSGYLWQGGREDGDLPLFVGFVPQDTASPHAALNTLNPFGVEGLFYSAGTNPRIIERSSVANTARVAASFFAGEMNELRGVLSFTGYDFISGSILVEESRVLTDNFQYTPRQGDFYLSDRLHFNNSWVEPGLGIIYLETERADSLVDDDTLDIKLSLMPRVVASTSLRGFDIQAGSDLAAGTLPFSYFLDNVSGTIRADTMLILPQTPPSAERSWRTWITTRGKITRNWCAGIDLSSNLTYNIPTIELVSSGDTLSSAAGIYLKAKGFSLTAMPWVGYDSRWFAFNLAYRYSSNKSTSQGILNDYERLLKGDSAYDVMNRTSLDSKHKIVLDTRLQTPGELPFLAREWFLLPRIALASGFPGEESSGKSPWWAWLELTLGRTFTFGIFQPVLEATLLNPFGWTEPIIGTVAEPALPTEADYPDNVYLGESGYHSSRDSNHDGCITAGEEVSAYKKAIDFYSAWTLGPIPARNIEVKFTFRF